MTELLINFSVQCITLAINIDKSNSRSIIRMLLIGINKYLLIMANWEFGRAFNLRNRLRIFQIASGLKMSIRA